MVNSWIIISIKVLCISFIDFFLSLLTVETLVAFYRGLHCFSKYPFMCTSIQRVGQNTRKKANFRNQYNQVLHLTQETIWECDKNTRKHHIQESQEVCPFPAGDHKALRNRQDSMTKNTKDPKRNTVLLR